MKKLKLMVQGAAAAVALTLAFGVNAQNAQPPAGLKWIAMKEIVFNSNTLTSTGTPEDKSLLGKIWAKEIGEGERDPADGKLPVSITLMGEIVHGNDRVVLTMYDRIGSDCIPPGNGGYDMYATCPLRVLWWAGGKQLEIKNLPVNYCMMYGVDINNSRTKNHNEYAFDARTGIVYLRLIQYGKIVPKCNRALRVLKI
jgi:hypothetical protein